MVIARNAGGHGEGVGRRGNQLFQDCRRKVQASVPGCVLGLRAHRRGDCAGVRDPGLGVDLGRWNDSVLKYVDRRGEIEIEPNMPMSHVAREFDIRGPAYNCLTACAASTQAVGEAFDILRRGDAGREGRQKNDYKSDYQALSHNSLLCCYGVYQIGEL